MVKGWTHPASSRKYRAHTAADSRSFLAETIVLHSIPKKYTTEELLAEVNALVPTVGYNFVLMPRNNRTDYNLGFCFMNCACFDAADAYFRALSGHQWAAYPCSRMRCRVEAAKMQGISRNMDHWVRTTTGSSWKHLRQVPLVFDEWGKNMDIFDAVAKFCSKEMRAESDARLLKEGLESEDAHPRRKDKKGSNAQSQPRHAPAAATTVELTNIPMPKFVSVPGHESPRRGQVPSDAAVARTEKLPSAKEISRRSTRAKKNGRDTAVAG